MGRYFEGGLLGTKTSKTKELMTTLLPLVVPLDGLSGLDWWGEFLNTREMLGLEDIPLEGEVEAMKSTAEKVAPRAVCTRWQRKLF